jgi:hypothetical protein
LAGSSSADFVPLLRPRYAGVFSSAGGKKWEGVLELWLLVSFGRRRSGWWRGPRLGWGLRQEELLPVLDAVDGLL